VSEPTLVGSVIFFSANEGLGYQLYRTDGTSSGTQRLTGSETEYVDTEPVGLRECGGQLCLSMISTGHGFEPHVCSP
jgi:ELWxxDGT repeat protein